MARSRKTTPLELAAWPLITKIAAACSLTDKPPSDARAALEQKKNPLQLEPRTSQTDTAC